MKVALYIGFSPDRRSATALGEPAPADQVIAAVKADIAANRIRDARFPIIAAVGLTNVLREHTFRPTDEQLAAANATAEVIPSEDELNAVLAANEKLTVEAEAATKRILELEAQVAAATAKPPKK